MLSILRKIPKQPNVLLIAMWRPHPLLTTAQQPHLLTPSWQLYLHWLLWQPHFLLMWAQQPYPPPDDNVAVPFPTHVASPDPAPHHVQKLAQRAFVKVIVLPASGRRTTGKVFMAAIKWVLDGGKLHVTFIWRSSQGLQLTGPINLPLKMNRSRSLMKLRKSYRNPSLIDVDICL